MKDCIFCEIGKGKIPSYTIYEDETFISFLDIHPASKGHALVIPKQHGDIDEIPEELFATLQLKARELKRRLKEVLEVDLIAAATVGVDVPGHAHIHLVPIYDGNEMYLTQDFDAEPDHTSLSVVANKLKLDGLEDSAE